MPAPPARSFSASVPCGVSDSSSSPASTWRSNSLFSPTYEAMTFFTCRVLSRRPIPKSSTPALLPTMVRPSPREGALSLCRVRPEPGCTAHAARIAVRVANERSVDAIRKHPWRPKRRHRIVETQHIRHSSTEHDGVRVEDVDDVRKCPGKPFFVATHRVLALNIAARGARLD